jgi:CRP-like cAMP-binding protein
MTASGRPPNQLLQTLDAAVFDLLRPHLVAIELVRKTVLSEADAALRHVYFPHDGAVSITVGLSEGQTIDVAMIGRDGIVAGGAALADGIAVSDAVVLLPGTASAVEVSAFRNIAAVSVPFRGLVIRHEQALFARAQQSLLCNTLHPVEARLARWLLRAHDLSDRESLPLTQETLAQMMGVRRNAVSLVAHALQRAGIIRYSRGRIEITDLRALQAMSCDCYSAAKTHHARLLGLLDAHGQAMGCIPECTQGGRDKRSLIGHVRDC